MKLELSEDRQTWSRENVQKVVDPNKNRQSGDTDHGNRDVSKQQKPKKMGKVKPQKAAVQYSQIPANKYQINSCHGNRGNIPQQPRDVKMGPVCGVEDKRPEIFRFIPGYQENIN